MFDAGVAAWGMKFKEDTVRPVTTINELFKGSVVSDWRGNRTATIDDKDLWRPYQLRRNIVPPFPDIPSGHSAFSTSASVVLRNLLGTNVFDYDTEPFISRFDLDDGFDGDPNNGNEEVILNWKTISQAADAAGYSRLLGGIHMMQGNVIGLEMGARVGHSTLKHLRHLFGDSDIGQDPVEDVFDHIVMGTGRDDDLLVAPCVEDSPVEVYGFYGDDGETLPARYSICIAPFILFLSLLIILSSHCSTFWLQLLCLARTLVLELNHPGVCGPVSFFGGDGMDVFRVGGMVTIQDYEDQDIIVLLQGEGTISTVASDSVTTVFVDDDAVLMVDGVWNTEELNIVFSSRRRRRAPRGNTVVNFSQLAVEWVKLSERGPTISSHFMAHVNAALFDAYAAFEPDTTGAITNLDDGVRVDDSDLPPEEFRDAQLHSMAAAAHEVITTLGSRLLQQRYLEIENGENATERLSELLEDADAVRDEVVVRLDLQGDALAIAEGVSEAVSEAILKHVTEDGSNYQNDYQDTSGYAIRPMFEPVPVVSCFCCM